MHEDTSEYDVRQYNLMLRMIQEYQNGSIEIGNLTQGLDELRSALENASESWQQEFNSGWGVVEDVYAVMLDRGDFRLNDSEKELVNKAVEKLKNLIANQVEKGTLF